MFVVSISASLITIFEIFNQINIYFPVINLVVKSLSRLEREAERKAEARNFHTDSETMISPILVKHAQCKMEVQRALKSFKSENRSGGVDEKTSDGACGRSDASERDIPTEATENSPLNQELQRLTGLSENFLKMQKPSLDRLDELQDAGKGGKMLLDALLRFYSQLCREDGRTMDANTPSLARRGEYFEGLQDETARNPYQPESLATLFNLRKKTRIGKRLLNQEKIAKVLELIEQFRNDKMGIPEHNLADKHKAGVKEAPQSPPENSRSACATKARGYSMSKLQVRWREPEGIRCLRRKVEGAIGTHKNLLRQQDALQQDIEEIKLDIEFSESKLDESEKLCAIRSQTREFASMKNRMLESMLDDKIEQLRRQKKNKSNQKAIEELLDMVNVEMTILELIEKNNASMLSSLSDIKLCKRGINDPRS